MISETENKVIFPDLLNFMIDELDRINGNSGKTGKITPNHNNNLQPRQSTLWESRLTTKETEKFMHLSKYKLSQSPRNTLILHNFVIFQI